MRFQNMPTPYDVCKLELAADLDRPDEHEHARRRQISCVAVVLQTPHPGREQRQPHHAEYLTTNTDGMSSCPRSICLVVAVVITIDG